MHKLFVISEVMLIHFYYLVMYTLFVIPFIKIFIPNVIIHSYQKVDISIVSTSIQVSGVCQLLKKFEPDSKYKNNAYRSLQFTVT